jgi:hypothetical protein
LRQAPGVDLQHATGVKCKKPAYVGKIDRYNHKGASGERRQANTVKNSKIAVFLCRPPVFYIFRNVMKIPTPENNGSVSLKSRPKSLLNFSNNMVKAGGANRLLDWGAGSYRITMS